MTTFIVVYWYGGHLSVITVQAQSSTHAMSQVALMDHVLDSSLVVGAAMAHDGGFTIQDASGQAIRIEDLT